MSYSAIIYLGGISLEHGEFATKEVASPDNIPPLCMRVSIEKSLLFKDQLTYNIETDASGLIISTLATEALNISNEYLAEQFSLPKTYWSQVDEAASSIYTIQYSFDNVIKSTPFSISTPSNVIGLPTARLGEHIIILASQAIKLTPPRSIDEIYMDISGLSHSLETAISSALTAFMNTQQCQNAILNAIIQMNGPVINTTSGTHSLEVIHEFQNMSFAFIINDITMQVDFNGITRLVTLNNVPIVLDLQ